MECKKCKSALVKCSDCNGAGKAGFNKPNTCIRCSGTGYLCQIHGAGHGNPRK